MSNEETHAWSSSLRHCLARWAMRREQRGESTELDHRGLVPVEVAREVLDEHRVMQSGIPRYYGGPVREGAYRAEELIWGALLSLEDADEFHARAETIRWMEGPGIVEQPTLVERYGSAVKGWLLAHIWRGALVNVPRGVKSSLIALGDRDVFDALWRVRDVTSYIEPSKELVSRHFEGPAEGWTFRADDAPTFAEPDREPFPHTDSHLIYPFVMAHPEVGVAALLERHAAGEARASEVLREVLTSRHDHMRVEAADALVEAAVGAKGLAKLKKKPRVKLTAEAILEQLDRCWSGEAQTAFLSWPYFEVGLSREVDEYHALRLVAFRGTGASWGLLFQRLSGVPFHPHEPMGRQPFSYGSECELGQDHADAYRLHVSEDPGGPGLDGIVLDGRGGPLALSDAMIEELDLRPGQSVESHGGEHRANLMARAFFAARPEAVWAGEDPKYLRKRVLDKGKLLLVSEAFEHVGLAPGEPGAIKPSESPVFRSLAAALVKKDPALFEPGTSNLDWRLHASPSPDGGDPPLTL